MSESKNEGIRPGMLVRLKLGLGPKMIADGHDHENKAVPTVACFWFAAGDIYQRANFRESDLEVVPK